MSDIKRLFQLCQQYTTLDNSDIEILQKVADLLPYLSELTGNDIFINALTESGNESISLAWAKPNHKTAYSASPVGELVYSFNEPAVFHTLKTGETTRDVRGVSPEGVPIAQTVVSIVGSLQKVVGALVMEKDISKELQQEENVEYLRYTAEHLSSTLLHLSTSETTFEDWLGNGILILNRQGRITYASRIAAHIYKIQTGIEALGNNFFALFPNCSSIEDVLENLKNSQELTIKDSSYRLKAFPLFTTRELSGCVISVYDYTELRKKELELNAKSLIIQEINHRVKNNLQNIAAVLKLQMNRSSSDIVKAEFSSSINRIMSIAFAHEVFAQKSWETIDLLELCKKILYSLIDSAGFSHDQLKTSVTGPSIQLSSSQAIPLALVINELITNSIKHCIAPCGSGQISIKIIDHNGWITLTVSDCGDGQYDKNAEVPKTGLGLQIVNALVREKLEGFFRLGQKNGITRAIVCFTLRSQEEK